jgi:hypothetical protein
MKRRKKPRLWAAGVTVLALFSFLAGTSLACFQRETANITLAEDCCQSHCQHAMSGEAAVDCCQSHHAQASHTLLSLSPVKTLALSAPTLLVALISPAVWQNLDHAWLRQPIAERPQPSFPLYALHCALLI